MNLQSKDTHKLLRNKSFTELIQGTVWNKEYPANNYKDLRHRQEPSPGDGEESTPWICQPGHAFPGRGTSPQDMLDHAGPHRAGAHPAPSLEHEQGEEAAAHFQAGFSVSTDMPKPCLSTGSSTAGLCPTLAAAWVVILLLSNQPTISAPSSFLISQ